VAGGGDRGKSRGESGLGLKLWKNGQVRKKRIVSVTMPQGRGKELENKKGCGRRLAGCRVIKYLGDED